MPSDRPKKPHGRFTPASTIGRVLNAAGYGASTIRKGVVAFGGHRCSWDEVQQRVRVGYRCGDDTPDDHMDAERAEMFDLYEQLLTTMGYPVERSERFLHVSLDKQSKT